MCAHSKLPSWREEDWLGMQQQQQHDSHNLPFFLQDEKVIILHRSNNNCLGSMKLTDYWKTPNQKWHRAAKMGWIFGGSFISPLPVSRFLAAQPVSEWILVALRSALQCGWYHRESYVLTTRTWYDISIEKYIGFKSRKNRKKSTLAKNQSICDIVSVYWSPCHT